MVNGNADKNNSCANLKPAESVQQQIRNENGVFPCSSNICSQISSSDEVPCVNGQDKVRVPSEEDGSRAMDDAPAKTSLLCSVPLNKIRSVLNNVGGKNDEEENSSKINQISRKILCLYCDRSFVSLNLRQKHVERCHSEKQSRRLSSRKLQSQFTTTACFYCDKLPVEHSLRQLFEHLISTHSLKYFGCLLCEERFLNQIQLNDHNAKHHNSSQREQKKFQNTKIKTDNEEADERRQGNTERSTGNEQKSAKITVKKKKTTTNSKPPPRQLRNRKQVTIKASKVGSKRSKRLQSAQNKVSVRKKKAKVVETSKSDENALKITDKVKTTSVNPYPEFDNYYRVKKITDHSIDNLKISSLTFDDVFDKAFFSKIKCNIQENLLYHLDGKLFKNEASESRISNFEKNPPTQEVSSNSSENFGCDLSLNAVTPVTSISTANFGEDLESQIEYGSKPSKKKLQVRQDPVRHKYVTRRKYQASILEHKENRDLSKLDMWTQLVIKDRQQKVLNGQKSAKEILEYTNCAEYKQNIQRNELNRILDRRGPFEDLKEEASKKATLEQLNLDSSNVMSEECFKEVRSLMEDLLEEVVKNCSEGQEDLFSILNLNEKAEFPDKEDIPELPDYLKLRSISSVKTEDEIDKSDKIALICSSQETENYELPTNTVRSKDEMIELSGEWARSRIYVCAACGLKIGNMKLLIDHKSMYHQNSWVQHYELVGNQSELYRHLCIPGLGKVGQVEKTIPCKLWSKSESRVCTKCGKVTNSLSELHRHILECGGDWTWMLARKKCKYRPFGARKKRRGLVKRIRESNQKTDQTDKKKYKKTFEGPRQRPSDADTIQRMLANLPPKRSSRKSICMKDGFPRNQQKSPKNKKQVMKCGKIVRHKSTYNTNQETTKNPTNHKNTSVTKTLRSISRTLSSKILDTNSKLKVKRKLIQKISRRSPRKNRQEKSETTNPVSDKESKGKIQNNLKKTIHTVKNKRGENPDKVKSVFKDKINMKNFFPVSKRKVSKNMPKKTENLEPDSSPKSASTLNDKMEKDSTKTSKTVIKRIKKSLTFKKAGNVNEDVNKAANPEPIVVIEKLRQTEQTEKQPSSTNKKATKKRKLRSSFLNVIDKVKKLKLDSSAAVPSGKNNEMSPKHSNSFLGQGAREKEKLGTVLVPLVEELKESPPSNLAFVQNAMDNNSPTEESLIPENIFNLQHNSEDLLQAKSPLGTLTNEIKKNEKLNYFSAKVCNIPESVDEVCNTSPAIITKSDVMVSTSKIEVSNNITNFHCESTKEVSLLSVETTTRPDKSSLVSPILSPSTLSPKMKAKVRKPNRRLNDCIAMLTKKAFEETHKTEDIPNPVKVPDNIPLDNKNEAHKIIRANECILKIPVIESSSLIQSEVLDLSKPKKNTESCHPSEKIEIESPLPKQTAFWNPINDMKCNRQTSLNNSNIYWGTESPKTQHAIVNPPNEKPILKIPRFVEVSRMNNVDSIIQGVIENYDESVIKPDPLKPHLKVSSIGLLNSIDKVIEEVVKGNCTIASNELASIQNVNASSDEINVLQEDSKVALQSSAKSENAVESNIQHNNSASEIESLMVPVNVPSTQEGSNEYEILPSKLPDTSDAPQTILKSSLDSTVNETHVEFVNTTPASLPNVSLEVLKNNIEYSSSASLDQKSSSNLEIFAENLVDSAIYNEPVKKKPTKKIKEIRKKSTKKSVKKSKSKRIEQEREMSDGKNDKLKILSQTLKDQEILGNTDQWISAHEDIPLIKLTTQYNSDEISSSHKTAAVIKCCEMEQINTGEEEIDKKEVTNNKPAIKCIEPLQIKNIPSQQTTLSLEKESKSEAILSANNKESDFKTNSTDSEDELPLLVLKTKSKKKNLKVIEEVVGNTTGESTIETEPNKILFPECEKENNELYEEKGKTDNTKFEKKIIEVTKIFENDTILTAEKVPTETEEILHSQQCSDSENVEITHQNDERRQSSRMASKSVTLKINKNSKTSLKGNKLKKSSKQKSNPELVEPIDKEKIIENISNITEPFKHSNISEYGVCKTATTDKTLISNSSSDAMTKDAHEKPKNFLVGSNVSTFKNTTNPVISSKSHRKKNKNKHDMVKTKLIFKFPKIILKEPVLRIPPRDVANSTSFGKETENSHENGIKLILDNPFSNIKEREEKILSITNFPDISQKRTDNEVTLKNKSPNKKKSNKHKKKSSKSSVKVENKNEITSDESHIIFDKELTSLDKNKEHLSEQGNMKSLPDDSNIFKSNDKKNEIAHLSEVTTKQPITLKLQANSLKNFVAKNLKKKKNKLKKTSLSLIKNEDDNLSQNEISGERNLLSNIIISPKSNDITKFQTIPEAEKTQNDAEISSILNIQNINENETRSISPNESLILNSHKNEKKPTEKLPISFQPSDNFREDNIGTDSKDITVKTGRSLRSTVKITHKESNIFALQIEGEEIKDVEKIEKPKNLQSERSIVEKEKVDFDVKSNILEHNKNETTEEIPEYNSFEKDIKIVSDKKKFGGKNVDTDCEQFLENEIVGGIVNSICLTTENEKTSKKLDQLDQVVEKPVAKSKKIKKLSKIKKVLNKVSGFCSTLDTNSSLPMEISDEKKEGDCNNATSTIENKILEEIVIPNKTQLSNENIFSETNIGQNLLGTQAVKSIEDHFSSGKYEDSSFSEGELVINESFENQEGNIFEEFADTEIKKKSFTAVIENAPAEDESVFDFSRNVTDQKKSNRRNSKAISSKYQKLLDGSNILKTIEHTNSKTNLSFRQNEILLREEIKEKVQTSLAIDQLENINSEQDITNICEESSIIEVAPKNNDEYVFEEDSLPLYEISTKGKIKDIDVGKNGDFGMNSESINEKILKAKTDSFSSSDVGFQTLGLNSIKGKPRSAKSKALDCIIEKQLDDFLDIEPQINTCKEKISVSSLNEKETMRHTHLENDPITTHDSLLPGDKELNEKSYDLPQRRSRAAKARAIQNIKVLESKITDVEEIDESVKNMHDADHNSKLKKKGKSKETLYSQSETKKNPFCNKLGDKNALERKSIIENENITTQLSLSTSAMSFSITEMSSGSINVENLQKPDEKISRNDSISLNREKDEIKVSSVKKDKIPNYKHPKSNVSKSISYKKDNIVTANIIEETSAEKLDTCPLIDIFSSGTNSDTTQKQKRNRTHYRASNNAETSNKTDCYDISNIDDDNNIENEESILLSPLKKKKKSIKNEGNIFKEDIKENYPKAEEIPKCRGAKAKALENIHDISQSTDSNEMDHIDSLDVTLKTTVDEISSILMENIEKSERPSCSSSFRTFDEYAGKTLKKKRNRDVNCEDFTPEKESVANIELDTEYEMDIKRRSKRACKVNTYNENDLAEAIFEQVESEKEKTKKKRADEAIINSSSCLSSKKVIPYKTSSEKKLNSDELFDLLKTTAPDNLIALKPVEENPSGTPNTDDNFDDEFDDILRKSEALFGGRPYKKLDDIRSDDSSSASKLTDVGRQDENTESDDAIKKSEDSYIDYISLNNSTLSSVSKNQKNRTDGHLTTKSDDLYCDICKKSFKRIDNLIKHRTTLTHIAKLSEMEAKEAENKFVTQTNEDSSLSNVAIDSEKQSNSGSYSYHSNPGNDALELAEIITEGFEKPTSQVETGFSEMVNTPSSEYRRCKSLGERKSFEYDQDNPNICQNLDTNHYESKISKNTGVILEKQINLLQNIMGLDCENDASSSSYRSLGNSIRGISPVSELSTKLEDSSNLDLDGDTERTPVNGDFLKPPQIEDISEDSVNPKNAEDVKSRKVLNRDEELFLECCSLLKSGSEVSNFSKKSNRNSFLNNLPMKITDEPDVMETKNMIYKVTEDSSDYSRRATPLGDSFGDTSNSNTISSSWELKQNDQPHKIQENFFNFSDAKKDIDKNRDFSNSSVINNTDFSDDVKLCLPMERNPNFGMKISKKEEKNPNTSNQNMPTKGALKNFEGFKISEQKLDSSTKITINKSESDSLEATVADEKFLSPKTPRRKSKPVKNKPQIDDRFIFKVNKKPSLKDTEEPKSQSSSETVTDKISDVYDFEETQDNTEIFTKPDFKSFRTKGVDIIKDETIIETNYDAQTMSSSSSSNISNKKTKMNECITKNKHMIMGRIFKNAVKPKLDEEISDLPAIDHNELVENYVLSCAPKPEEEEFKKPKMTEDEMNYLFDKLLDRPTESPKKPCNSNKVDQKNTGTKKKLKIKYKKRQRSNSDSTDDEFGLNKIVKKRPGRKNAREEDNSINLEQELKECIGVASRKSQRKCTSGKQNVLVEYWSSDESAFETIIENHLQELSDKSDIPLNKGTADGKTEDVKMMTKDNPPKNSIFEKNKKPRSKPKSLSKKKEIKETSVLNEPSKNSVQSNRRKRNAAHPLYHWSSSSEDELQDFIEVKSARDDPDEYDEERPVQHGWIVGDSPKKLVTMLAQAKGKKTEPESLVKEQGKKKNSNS